MTNVKNNSSIEYYLWQWYKDLLLILYREANFSVERYYSLTVDQRKITAVVFSWQVQDRTAYDAEVSQ